MRKPSAITLLKRALWGCLTSALLWSSLAGTTPGETALVVFPVAHWKTTASGGTAPSVAQSSNTGATDADCGATISISFSTTPANGQLIILIVMDNTTAGPTSFSGFTAVTGGSDACRVFWKIAASETNSYSYTYAGAATGDASQFLGYVFTGNHATTPIDTTANTANSRTTPSITTTQGFEYVLTVGGSIGGTSDFHTFPSGWSGVTFGSRGNIGYGVAYLIQTAAGATGAANWNTGTYSNSKVFTIGIRSV